MIRGTKIEQKAKDTRYSVIRANLIQYLVPFLAEKERFELSRRYSRPTPLAGAPLRPLEYFSGYSSPAAGCIGLRLLYYTHFSPFCQALFYKSFGNFSETFGNQPRIPSKTVGKGLILSTPSPFSRLSIRSKGFVSPLERLLFFSISVLILAKSPRSASARYRNGSFPDILPQPRRRHPGSTSWDSFPRRPSWYNTYLPHPLRK